MKVAPFGSVATYLFFDVQVHCLTFYKREEVFRKAMQETIYVGLDLGSSFCCQSIINADGSPRSSRLVRTSEQHLRDAFTGLNGEVRVHMEAGELADWVGSVIGPLVSRVVVSHPRSLAWIGKDAVKDDKVDAGKLAELLRLGRVHEVYFEEDSKRRIFKHLVTHHEQTSREQARRKSKIKARLRTLGVIRKDARLFSADGQAALLESVEQPEIKRMIALKVSPVLNRMLECEREAKHAMLEYSKRFPEVRLLQTAPGVGAIMACRFVGYLHTPLRFSNKRKLWRYF
jgi:transposase